jgi:hypothetical protein
MEALARARTLTLSRESSERAEPLAALARLCYPDMAVSVEQTATSWLVHLAPPGELIRLYDDRIAAALSANGIGFDEMADWHRLADLGGVVWLESMYPCCALVAWSRLLHDDDQARPLLVRIARNEDLGVPALLGGQVGPLVAIMEDVEVALENQANVLTALASGLIGVGSYLTPWLRARPSDVLHLAPAAPEGEIFRFDIEPEVAGEVSRLLIRERGGGSCSYQQISDPALLSHAWSRGRPVLLDIDLSYFALLPKKGRASSSASCSVAAVLEGLRPFAPAIAAVTIAYAPGSCPAKCWAPLAAELREGLISLLAATAERADP